MVDNLGWGELGCYGGGVLRGAETPRLDQPATEGTRLLNFNVEPQCTPSRSAFMTGRHPIRSGTTKVVWGVLYGMVGWERTIAELMSEAGYDQAEIDAARRMLRKQGIKRDDDVQALEDVICFVFLKWYFEPFATKHSDETIQRLVEKTARKMSAEARRRVLDEFDLPEDLASAFKD